MSYYQNKKDSEKTLINQADTEEISGSGERQPEFDVHGTALNDLHSHIES